MTEQITLKDYCPKSKYGNHIQDIIRQIVQIEDEYNHKYVAPPLPPKYKKIKLPFTIASSVAFGRNIIKSVLP